MKLVSGLSPLSWSHPCSSWTSFPPCGAVSWLGLGRAASLGLTRVIELQALEDLHVQLLHLQGKGMFAR